MLSSRQLKKETEEISRTLEELARKREEVARAQENALNSYQLELLSIGEISDTEFEEIE